MGFRFFIEKLSFSLIKGDISVSNVNDTDNTAQGNTAFYVYQSQNTYINYSYFKGNKATSSRNGIFCYNSIPSSETYSCVFLNNSVVDSGWGIFGFLYSGTHILRECIIKYNEHKYLISVLDSTISVIRCFIEGNTYSQTFMGLGTTQIETTNNLVVALNILFIEECQKENIAMNDDLEVRYEKCLADKHALEFKCGIRPTLHYILTVSDE